VILYLVGQADPNLWAQMLLVPQLVMQGEVWRLLTFVFMPPPVNVLFFFIEMMLLWTFGSALESFWGSFRYNLFVGVGFVLSIAAAFAFPQMPATNVYVISTIFLAFAFLNPNYELLLFFVLPVKVKWLALITWLLYGYTVVTGGWPARLLILAGVANFGLFFGGELIRTLKDGDRRRKHQKDWERKLRDDD
jgi:membrane associated rhomboid family serine protease